MWWVIGGRRIRGEVLVFGAVFASTVVGLALGMDPRTLAFVAVFAVLVAGVNALSSRGRGKHPGAESGAGDAEYDNADPP